MDMAVGRRMTLRRILTKFSWNVSFGANLLPRTRLSDAHGQTDTERRETNPRSVSTEENAIAASYERISAYAMRCSSRGSRSSRQKIRHRHERDSYIKTQFASTSAAADRAAFAAGRSCFVLRPMACRALRVRGLSAESGNLALSFRRHRRES